MQILDAARLCFARSGFHGASMQQICAEARMSPGALYRYYPSKDAIIEAIAEDERMRAREVLTHMAAEGSLVDRIVTAGLAYLRMMKRPGAGELMVEVCAESMRNTAVGSRFHCVESEVRGQFRLALESAQAAGEITRAIDVETILLMLFSIGDGLALRMGLEKDLDVAAVEPALRRTVAGLLDP